MTATKTSVEHLLTVPVAEMLLGVPVNEVREVLYQREPQAVPLASPDVVGVLNVRGDILTVLDLRTILGFDVAPEPLADRPCVVVESQGEAIGLRVDQVGEVLSPAAEQFEATPASLDAEMRRHLRGVYKLADAVLLVLDVEEVLAQEGDGMALSGVSESPVLNGEPREDGT